MYTQAVYTRQQSFNLAPVLSISYDLTLAVDELEANVLSIYPNPSQDGIFVISLKEEVEHLTIGVTNMLGQELEATINRNSPTNFTVDLSENPTGVYVLSLDNEMGAFYSAQLVVE